ncbi:MAG: sigma-70 family RNA polymerase sigma factor [Bryobacteraceae bacterium]|nr:sigma-70 family RNA polymerase sigma factor [Bryobacteraceae bacterium]
MEKMQEEERQALDRLFSVTYEELRRLAYAVRRSDPGATLSPTALVHEAWLKLAHSPQLASTSRLHFKRIAARAMRQLLIEASRRRNAQKRGSGVDLLPLSPFADFSGTGVSCEEELLTLDAALAELEQMDARQAQIVESRFFGGLSIAETAELLEVSEETIFRDWRAARAWLAHKLRRIN